MSGNLVRSSFALPAESFERIRFISERIGCTQGAVIESLLELDDETIVAHVKKVAPILEAKAAARKDKRRMARKALESLSDEALQAILANAKT